MLKIFVCHFLTKLHPFFTYEGGNKENVFLNTVLQGQKQKNWAVFLLQNWHLPCIREIKRRKQSQKSDQNAQQIIFPPARIFKQAKKKGKWDDSKSKDPPGRYVVGQIVPSSGFPSPTTTLLHQKMIVHSWTICSRGNHSGVKIWLQTQLQVQI